ncbi:MAG: type II toxin-antitoxin system RelE/ParE family toxin [Armatimonadetes bacterium]|nr:type II toxin-antitoxin system RelE/ParE family toxin [Armatimonadota bacterium]
MSVQFKCGETEQIFHGAVSKVLPADIQKIARRKIRMLEAAINLNDLRQPPGNRLEKLSGNREGQWSIRVNDQWRVCFVWKDDRAYEVELTKHYK